MEYFFRIKELKVRDRNLTGKLFYSMYFLKVIKDNLEVKVFKIIKR